MNLVKTKNSTQRANKGKTQTQTHFLPQRPQRHREGKTQKQDEQDASQQDKKIKKCNFFQTLFI